MDRKTSFCRAFFIAIAIWACSAAENCDPTCAGKEPGSFVPDPHDCHRYYGCMENGNVTDIVFTCPDGFYFDSYFEECDTEYTPCQSACPLPGCSLTCHEDTDVLLYPGDCSRYRQCGPGGTITTQTCGSLTPYFNGRICQFDPSQCCDACEIRCNYVGTEIVDPYNCTNYYFCTSYYSSILGSCGSDSHFDPTVEKCVEGSQCENVCSSTSTTPSFQP